MQISKACSIEFLSARTIWQLVYKEDFKCSRLMAATFVTSCNTTKVRVLDFIVPRPPTQINAYRISIIFIFSYILNFLRGRNEDYERICYVDMFIINAMWSCNERTTLHCAYSYLYYIIWIKKKNIFGGMKRGRK